MLMTMSLLAGLLTSVLLTGLILGSLAYNPRLWVGDAPDEMQAAAAPLTRIESRMRTAIAVPFFIIILVVPFGALFWYEMNYGALSFWNAFRFLWVTLMTFNLVDLILIDWLVVVWWQPSWTILKEAEHLYELNSYTFHFYAFLKGCIGITVFTLLAAAVIAFI